MLPDLNTLRDLQDFGDLELLARQVVEGFITGLHKSPFHGFSVEFAEHRLYNGGESVKNIDWKLYARTERLFVKQFEEETNLRCQMVIDVSSSMYYPEQEFNKLLFSACAAASLMYLLHRQRDAFGLSFFSESVELMTPVKSTGVHLKYLFGELHKAMRQTDLGRQTKLASALHEIAEQVHKRSLVVIFSDMLQSGANDLSEIFAGLQHLKYRKHEVIIFNVVDRRKELEFEFDNRPYHFIDVETGEGIKVSSTAVKENYLKAVQAFQSELHLRSAQFGIDVLDADIHEGFYKVLHTYLIKRSKML